MIQPSNKGTFPGAETVHSWTPERVPTCDIEYLEKKINQLRVELCREWKQKRVLEELCQELDANISELDPTLLEAVKELQSAECGVDTYASMMWDQVTCCS